MTAHDLEFEVILQRVMRESKLFVALVISHEKMERFEHINQLKWKPRFVVPYNRGSIPHALVMAARKDMGCDYAVLFKADGALLYGNPIGP